MKTLAAALGGAALFLSTATAQHTERWIYRPQRPFRLEPEIYQANRVVLKFREGLRVRRVRGRFTGLDREARALLSATLASDTVARLFTRPVDELDRERTELGKNLAAGEPPLADLNNYYLITTSGKTRTEFLVDELNTYPFVETAYAPFVPHMMQDIPPTTPSYTSQQGYLGAAPAGFEYNAIMSVVGARFPDNNMCHHEGSWLLGHEDHPGLVASNYLGSPPSFPFTMRGWMDHGTACTGIMAASRNAYGIHGMGSAARRFYLISLTNGSANSISLATRTLGPGDVMSSSYGGGPPTGPNYPIDFQQAEFDACRAAGAKGICYSIPAGNANDNLDDTSKFGNRYLPTSTSSTAFIAAATDGAKTVKASFSAWGTRIDANGWGMNVVSLGYGDLFYPNRDDRQTYTAQFGGTSAAAPLVAGVIAAFVGSVREQTGHILTVAEVRAALKKTGTKITGTQNIGNRPNLRQLLALYGLPDGLLVTQPGATGGSATYEVSGQNGQVFGVFLSPSRKRLKTPWNRNLLIDIGNAFPVGIGTLPASGKSKVALAIPNDAQLRGLDFYLQGVVFRGTTPHLTSSAELWIR